MAVDCHFHVIGDPAAFPLHPGRRYTPATASYPQWRAVMEPLGFHQGVVVQPSVYGTDNRALLAALAEAGGRLVGVGAVDGEVDDAELDRLVAAGVRGLRFAHFGAGDPRMMPGFVPLSALARLAPRLRARGLHADLFTDTRLLRDVAPWLASAGVPVVLDHMGRTPAALGITHDGMAALSDLLAGGACWVKLSGVANVSSAAPDYQDARPMHDWLVEHHAGRLVWGSDWPHTRASGSSPSTQGLVALFHAWTGDPTLRHRILDENARRLYRLPPAGPAPGA